MSEQDKNSKNSKEDRPTADQEQLRAFRIVITDLQKLARAGEPVTVDKKGTALIEKLAIALGREFVENGLSIAVHSPAVNGVRRAGGVEFSGGDALRASGTLGSLWLFPEDSAFSKQDIWTFYPDSNVALSKWVNSDDPNTIYTRTFDHWLGINEIEELGGLVATLEPVLPGKA